VRLGLRLAERRELAEALERLGRWLGEAGLPAAAVLDWRLVAEEILTNVFRHAGLTAGSAVELELELLPDRVRLVVCDEGRPFDPLAAPAPDLERPIPEHGEGGLGLVLLRALADELVYERLGSKNVLRLTRRR
jgi:anti-sigma regulatory factor (Ser/Thr protein kinase)